jgi:hypothetical protein
MTETDRERLDALRVDVAQALGWKFSSALEHTGYTVDALVTVTRPDGRSGKFHPARMMSWVPDWPRDDGAALRLALEVGGIVHAYKAGVRYTASYDPMLWRTVTDAFCDGKTPAEALTRLALAALQKEDD